MKTLWLIRGVPGAGKSTLARKMLAEGKATRHFEADMFFEKNCKYEFDAAKLHYAHSWCQRSAAAAMTTGEDIIVSNTFVKKKDMQYYIDAAASAGYQVEIIVADGNFKSVHNVPEEVVDRMRRTFQY